MNVTPRLVAAPDIPVDKGWFGGIRRCGFPGVRWEDVLEIYAPRSPPEVEKMRLVEKPIGSFLVAVL